MEVSSYTQEDGECGTSFDVIRGGLLQCLLWYVPVYLPGPGGYTGVSMYVPGL